MLSQATAATSAETVAQRGEQIKKLSCMHCVQVAVSAEHPKSRKGGIEKSKLPEGGMKNGPSVSDGGIPNGLEVMEGEGATGVSPSHPVTPQSAPRRQSLYSTTCDAQLEQHVAREQNFSL